MRKQKKIKSALKNWVRLAGMIICLFTLSGNEGLYAQVAELNCNCPKDSVPVYKQRAEAARRNGLNAEWLKWSERAYQVDSANRNLLLLYADALVANRRYHQSYPLFQKLVDGNTASDSLLKHVAKLAFQLRKWDDLVIYAQLWHTKQPDAQSSYLYARALYEQENYGLAIPALERAEKADASNAEIAYLLARCHADLLQYKKAIPCMERSIGIDSTAAYRIYELALICYAAHEDKDALKYMLLAGDKGYKRDTDYLENLAIAYLDAGETDKGVQTLQEILSRKPGDTRLLIMIAEACYYTGKYSEAAAYYEKMLEYDSQNGSAIYMYGMCYQKMGGKENKEKGARLCNKAIEIDPSLASLKQKKLSSGGL